ncbi:MAG: ATP-dependent Clp protease ATP-binding subunit [Patescibacteria group bacterium]
MPLDILNKFTSNLKNSLARAINLSWKYKNRQVLPIHLFIGLAEQKGSIAAEVIRKTNITPDILKQSLVNLEVSLNASFPPLSPLTTQSIERAALVAFNHHHVYIGTEHLLMALLQNPDNYLKQLFIAHKINVESLSRQILQILKNNGRFNDIAAVFGDEQSESALDPEHKASPSALEFFATNLCAENAQSKIDPVIGRDQEIERVIHVLSRRTKNNPVLIGEAGVGKTAIVEGLAKRIVEKNVPDILLDKQIYRLDLGLVVAGTMYRGEFESRFKQIIDELEKNKKIILFIDEIHTLIGAGAGGTGGGTMDAANILKPGLAKGNIRCIGATTLNEYQKHIESDAALERRFRPIIVEEASEKETIQIITGIKKNYEDYHNIHITADAILAAVKFSTRYIQDKFLPDKAIDLIDEAAAGTKVSQPIDPENLALRNLEHELDDISQKKLTMVRQEKFDQALAVKQQEEIIREKINKIRQARNSRPQKFIGSIDKKNIAQIISKITGIPIGELVAEEKNQLLHLNELLNARIIGQVEATKTISEFIRRARAGLTSPTRPTGSFIFLGPSGVGKTELAKQLAKILFGEKKSLIRIDMSEFSEKFNISKLIGAPAGYIGYKDGAKLTDQVKRHPYSVVLFDEIEKAHPDVFNLLLQILEDGQLADATGRQINFKNAIIIMTSNVGLKEFEQQAKIGFGETANKDNPAYEEVKNHALKKLKETFRPEFLNRIDKTIVFKPLTLNDLIAIAKLEMNELQNRLKEKQIKLSITNLVYKYLAELSFSPEQGARAIRKNIQELIENQLAEKILSDDLKPNQSIKIGYQNKKLTFSR